MSKFNIYTTKRENIKTIGKKSRRAALIYTLMVPLFFIPYIITRTIPTPFDYIILGTMLIILIAAIVFSYYNLKKLIIDGELFFYKTKAIKEVNSTKESWDLNLINKAILETHTKTANDKVNTYLLTLLFKDKSTQELVVGSETTDKPEVSLKKILQLSSKINKFELEIK